MTKTSKTTLAAMALMATLGFTGVANADCGIEKGSVRILSNDFEALRLLANKAQECASATVTVSKTQTTEHKNLQVPALAINPAEFTIAMVANNSISPLMNDGLIRTLNDLVAAYGQELQENQLVRSDGQIYAIAFMVNGQHLYLRRDILEQAGLPLPATYEDILEAAKVIREKGIMEYPLAAADKPGWDLAEEFVNMYLAHGGEFFEPGTANLAIDNAQGHATLAMMRELTKYMDPDYLTYDANELKLLWLGGKVAIMNQWASDSSDAIDLNGPAPEIAAATVLAAAPTVNGGAVPAGALFWDGFTIAKNISDEDAEASFRAMMHAMQKETATSNPTAAAWTIAGYEPGPNAVGIIANLQAGARPYPMLPQMGVLHSALSVELAEFIAGSEDADKAIADVSAAYNTAAREAGFLR